MLREGNIHTLPWIDKTMSVLRTHQLESCEKRLDALPEGGIFTVGDERAAEFWRMSFDGLEHPMLTHMYSIKELQSQVMLQAPAETTLLSQPESELLERMIETGGFAPLSDWNELDAAEALVRRLWCIVLKQDGHMALILQPPVMIASSMVIGSEEYNELRDKMAAFHNRVMALLYIHGVLTADEAIAGLGAIVRGTYADDQALVMRFLRTSYDYTYDAKGRMVLIHPGLAHPETLTADSAAWKTKLDPTRMEMASNGCLPQEKPLLDRLTGTLRCAVRPEIGEEDAALDLMILAKQNVDPEEMKRVLASMLIMQPTDTMLSALQALWSQTPRWGRSSMGVLQ